MSVGQSADIQSMAPVLQVRDLVSGGWVTVDPGVTGQDKILETIKDFEGNIWFRVDPNDVGGIIVYNHKTKNTNWLSTTSNGDLPSNNIYDLSFSPLLR